VSDTSSRVDFDPLYERVVPNMSEPSMPKSEPTEVEVAEPGTVVADARAR
jgi:hypothetical protein